MIDSGVKIRASSNTDGGSKYLRQVLARGEAQGSEYTGLTHLYLSSVQKGFIPKDAQ
jgi:hypothetical protein